MPLNCSAWKISPHRLEYSPEPAMIFAFEEVPSMQTLVVYADDVPAHDWVQAIVDRYSS